MIQRIERERHDRPTSNHGLSPRDIFQDENDGKYQPQNFVFQVQSTHKNHR